MTKRWYAGIDSGTQSTKALVIDETGRIAGRGAESYGLIDGLPAGHREQDPRVWIEALEHALGDALAMAGITTRDLTAIGVSGQQHGFVPLDKAGEPVRAAKLWNDTSTTEQCARIMDRCGGRPKYQELTGNSLPPGFTAGKILWLKENEPENFAKVEHVALPHDYLNFALSGEHRMEYGDASGTGLFDVRNRRWCAEAIAAIDDRLAQMLPPVAHSAEACGRARGFLAEHMGFSPDCIVSAGGGDNMMGAIGTGNVAPGVVTVSLGTSGTIYACSAEPVTDPQGEIAAFCDSTGQWLPLLCTMNVTVSTEMTRHLFDMDVEKLNELAASVPAGADGLMLIPYFEGERVPDVPDGTGVWFGWRAKTNTSGHYARAAMEGATLGLGYGFNRMRQLGIAPSEVRLTGGGSKSPLWRQIVADVLNTPVVCTEEAEGAALGAAAQAKWAADRAADPDALIRSVTDAWVRVDESSRCTPDPRNAARYSDLQTLHDQLSKDLRTAFASHAALIH